MSQDAAAWPAEEWEVKKTSWGMKTGFLECLSTMAVTFPPRTRPMEDLVSSSLQAVNAMFPRLVKETSRKTHTAQGQVRWLLRVKSANQFPWEDFTHQLWMETSLKKHPKRQHNGIRDISINLLGIISHLFALKGFVETHEYKIQVKLLNDSKQELYINGNLGFQTNPVNFLNSQETTHT